MNTIDFIIGLTLMNAMPHFVLGTWKARMFSGFGFGNKANLGYSVFNTAISLGLFLYKYGIDSTPLHGIYYGALFTLVCYFILGRYFYRQWTHEQNVDV